MTAIAILIVFGTCELWSPASWQLLKSSVLPGAIFGLPIGLVAAQGCVFGEHCYLGVDKPPGAEAYALCRATPVLYGHSLIGGFVLRLLSTTGFFDSGDRIGLLFELSEEDEVLVTAFSIYYFRLYGLYYF